MFVADNPKPSFQPNNPLSILATTILPSPSMISWIISLTLSGRTLRLRIRNPINLRTAALASNPSMRGTTNYSDVMLNLLAP